MNTVLRLLSEYGDLARTLYPREFTSLLKNTIVSAPNILRTKKLTALDAAMSQDMTVRFGHSRLAIPLRQIDQLLSPHRDNPSFGNVREMYARNCYLKHLHLKAPVHGVLDLGANRGMFSLLAIVHLGAEIVVGVEPQPYYDQVFQVLMDANRPTTCRAPRYLKLVGSPSSELADSKKYVSILTIMREQSIDRFDLVKMDIEGGEKDVFSEPDWLRHVENLTMELHPHIAGDLSLIPAALEKYGFRFRLVDQEGQDTTIPSAMFLVASRGSS